MQLLQTLREARQMFLTEQRQIRGAHMSSNSYVSGWYQEIGFPFDAFAAVLGRCLEKFTSFHCLTSRVRRCRVDVFAETSLLVGKYVLVADVRH